MTLLEQIDGPKQVKQLNSDQLDQLCGEIRSFLVNSVAQTGGHLASNLGAVELTVALHKVFDAPTDILVWDVGHQSYVHKLLTGRRNGFATLRQFGGMSGFPRSVESEYDPFNSGHSSNSISVALGFACARDQQHKTNSVVAILGDGAMTGGLAYEGLNNAGRMRTNFVVVLNDNEMSISRNVGGMSKYLNKIRTKPLYTKTKQGVTNALDRIPLIGSPLYRCLTWVQDNLHALFVQSSIFEQLGFAYYGPVDGHNIGELERVLSLAKKIQGPVLVHVLTKKGKGYAFAEENPPCFHGIGAFDVKTGQAHSGTSTTVSISRLFGQTLTDLARQDQNIIGITAAMPDGTGMSIFADQMPRRFYDVGIAEQHAVTFAGGMAMAGMVPVVAVYSTFLQRGYDSVFHDVALQNLHVVFALDRSGVAGEDGETHHGIYDFAYLSHLPNVSVLAPSDGEQFIQMLTYAVQRHNGPIAIRYPKSMPQQVEAAPFVFGKAQVVQAGTDVTLVVAGNMLSTALQAAQKCGKSVEVIDVRTIKPLDIETIQASARKTGKVITLEDHVKLGGMGSMVASRITQPVTILGYDDNPVTHGSIPQLHKLYGLDADGVAEQLQRCKEKEYTIEKTT